MAAVGSTAASQLQLDPELGLLSARSFASFPRGHIIFFQVLRFLPTVQKPAGR